MATDAPSRTPARPRKPACRIYVVRKKTIREFHLRPWLVVTAAVLGTAFFVAYFAATGYLFFRDDLLAASFAREARQKQAYEDRIAALRVDIDRLSSRQLLDQEAFEARLETVASRQAALDERQEILAGLSKAARNAGLVTTPGNAGDDFYLAAVTVGFASPPATGSLALTGDASASVPVGSLDSATSHTFSGVVLPADGAAKSITATFSADPACTLTNPAIAAVNACSSCAPTSGTSCSLPPSWASRRRWWRPTPRLPRSTGTPS